MPLNKLILFFCNKEEDVKIGYSMEEFSKVRAILKNEGIKQTNKRKLTFNTDE